MRRATKGWLITASAVMLLGILIFVGVMTVLKWDFTKLSTVELETNRHEISEDFDKISVRTDTADVFFALSEDGKCRVECYEEQKAKHSVTVQNHTLTIRVVNEKAWHDYIGLNFVSPKITVYLPKTEYDALEIKTSTGAIEIPKEMTLNSIEISVSTGDVACYASAAQAVKIKTTTGKICIEDLTAGSLDLSVSTGLVTVSGVNCEGDVRISVSTGKAKVSDLRCKNLTSTGSTGNITLKNVVAAEKFSVKRSTGDVRFDGCDAAEIFVETDTGNVTGTLLSEKVFVAESDTGSVKVPSSVTGGRCEVTTDTGNIKLDVTS